MSDHNETPAERIQRRMDGVKEMTAKVGAAADMAILAHFVERAGGDRMLGTFAMFERIVGRPINTREEAIRAAAECAASPDDEEMRGRWLKLAREIPQAAAILEAGSAVMDAVDDANDADFAEMDPALLPKFPEKPFWASGCLDYCPMTSGVALCEWALTCELVSDDGSDGGPFTACTHPDRIGLNEPIAGIPDDANHANWRIENIRPAGDDR